MIGFQQTEDFANKRQAAEARGGGGVVDSMEMRQDTLQMFQVIKRSVMSLLLPHREASLQGRQR